MKKSLLIFSLFLLYACTSVPLTGRKQFAPMHSSQMLALGQQSYAQVISESELSNSSKYKNRVRKVGNGMSIAIEQFFIEKNQADVVDHFEWEFNVIESDVVNAWCMPGGKIAFYEGIMPICKNRDGVAVVMGHEIAHAIAQHANERLGQQLAVQLGGLTLSAALQNKPRITQQLAMTAFGIGAQVGYVLPYSRMHESEADEMGLYFMALAGYDLYEAPKFWRRMLKNSKNGQRPPRLLSTHPMPEQRIKRLEALIPKVLRDIENIEQSGSIGH